MKIFRIAVFVVLIAILEVCVIQGLLKNRSFYIDLLAVITILASLEYGWVYSGSLAFGSGFIQDVFSGSPLGAGCISLAAGCIFAGSFRWILFSEHKSTRLVMVFIGSVIVVVTRFIIEVMYYNSVFISPASFFFRIVIPTAILNMLFSLVLYPLCAKYFFTAREEV